MISKGELHAWFLKQERAVRLVLATRAALRIFPTLTYTLRGASLADATDVRTNVILPAFRANAVAWVAARYPHNTPDLKKLAANAAEGALHASHLAYQYGSDDYSADVIEAAAIAASAVANSDSADSPFKAIELAHSAAARARSSETTDAAGAISAASLIDANAINGGTFSDVIAAQRLWPNAHPDWARDRWGNLKRVLRQSDENWGAWIDWHEARISGQLSIEAVELQRIGMPTRDGLLNRARPITCYPRRQGRRQLELPSLKSVRAGGPNTRFCLKELSAS